MTNEYDALVENKTWYLVPRLSYANVIRSVWVFRNKKNLDRSFEWYKARLACNGENQQTCVNRGDTFTSSSNHLLFAWLSVLLYLNHHGIFIN